MKKKSFLWEVRQDEWRGARRFHCHHKLPSHQCCVCPHSVKRAVNSEVCVCVQSIKAIQQISKEKEKNSNPSDPERPPWEHFNNKWMNCIQPLLSSQLTSRHVFNAIGAPTQQWLCLGAPHKSEIMWRQHQWAAVVLTQRLMMHFPNPVCRCRAPTVTNWTNWICRAFSYSTP